jgi:coenzyme F420-dependent glucose-6-phosphate dehydrogenase
MLRIGFTLSSEEQRPAELVRLAGIAEDAGFDFATISDHFHPWTTSQGNSPFVWPVLGGIATSTNHLRVGTAVTCPLIRLHPAIVAHAAATVAAMMPDRFFLGLGTGENLNEHVTGERWPSASERRALLREAVGVIRELWEGGLVEHRGPGFEVVDAQLFTLPDRLPPIYLAAAGTKAAELAGEIGDGLIGTTPDPQLIRTFEDAGGRGKPKLAQLTVCWAEDERTAVETAMTFWPTAGLKGELTQELPLPRHFEQAAEMVTEDQLTKVIVCGPDPEAHVAMVRRYQETGYDHVVIHQVGPDQEGGLRFLADRVLPELTREDTQKAS